jgi:hypothetical protein
MAAVQSIDSSMDSESILTLAPGKSTVTSIGRTAATSSQKSTASKRKAASEETANAL